MSYHDKLWNKCLLISRINNDKILLVFFFFFVHNRKNGSVVLNKNMAISVLGVMVAVPAKGAIPSTKYIQEAINNMSTPAGSVITGYGSVDGVQPYLLAGTGDGSAGWLSYSDLVSGLSGYLKGSQISGYGMGTGSEASYLLAGSNTTGSPFFVSVSNLGSRIGGYGYYNGNGSMILAGSGYGEAKWMSTYGLAAGLGSLIGSYLTYVPGSKVVAYGNMSAQSSGGYLLVGTGTGSAGWLDRYVYQARHPQSAHREK